MYVQFEHVRPTSVEALLSLLAEKKEGTILYGGGTDILVDLRDGKLKASRVIDVKNIPEFCEITETENTIRIGCAVTLSEIAENPLVQRWASSLAEGVSKVGSVQIRNKATLAGNIQTASPAGDGLNAAYALDGAAILISKSGERRIALTDYVNGPRRTAIQANEALGYIELPKREWNYQKFFKVGLRNALAISVVNGVVALEEKAGIITDARISVGAVAPTPRRIREAEALLCGKSLTKELAEEVAALVSGSVSPISDIRASAEYRAYMAGTMVKRQLMDYMEVRSV
ncbi:MAG: xanthine dehydrogenase family protein subunit M [Clostridia bacterium]|nr:xanthine dehydrogenase family protein subunit M [Clostridia bacterium]